MNADLQLSLRRDPVGPWVRMTSAQHWQPDATGVAESELQDRWGRSALPASTWCWPRLLLEKFPPGGV